MNIDPTPDKQLLRAWAKRQIAATNNMTHSNAIGDEVAEAFHNGQARAIRECIDDVIATFARAKQE